MISADTADEALIDQIHSLAIAWKSGATTDSDHHKALRHCAGRVIIALTTPRASADERIADLRNIAAAWSAGAKSSSGYHRAQRSCSDQVLGVLTDPQMGFAL